MSNVISTARLIALRRPLEPRDIQRATTTWRPSMVQHERRTIRAEHDILPAGTDDATLHIGGEHGLWGDADEKGNRPIYEPFALEVRRQVQIFAQARSAHAKIVK